MQASILPKRAVREAQKLGVSTAYLSGGVFRAALYWMRRCRATFFRARRYWALRTATPECPAHRRPTVRPTLRPTFRAAHLRRHPTSSAKIAEYNPRICVM